MNVVLSQSMSGGIMTSQPVTTASLICLSLDVVRLLIFFPVRAELMDLACYIAQLLQVISLYSITASDMRLAIHTIADLEDLGEPSLPNQLQQEVA